MVVRGTFNRVLLGIAVGCGVAALTAPALGVVLFRVSPTEPEIYICVAAILTALAVGATWIPARQTVRIQPREAMQEV